MTQPVKTGGTTSGGTVSGGSGAMVVVGSGPGHAAVGAATVVPATALGVPSPATATTPNS
ncbi:MAG: hypothetical protein WCK41_12005 [Actinomycetes bacterium]